MKWNAISYNQSQIMKLNQSWIKTIKSKSKFHQKEVLILIDRKTLPHNFFAKFFLQNLTTQRVKHKALSDDLKIRIQYYEAT